MQDNGDTYSIYLNCPGQPNSLTVQGGWTGIVRMYLLVDVQETIDYIDSVLGIAPEKSELHKHQE